MTRITVVTKIRFLAAIAPGVLLVAAPFLAGGFYVFGGEIARVREHGLAAIQAARGMEVALYQMEWARTQRDSTQILTDQRRAFGHWFDLARDRAETDDQRQNLALIAQQAEPLFNELPNSAPQDESVDRKARDLHGRISDLIGADELVLLELEAASRHEASKLIIVTLLAGVAIPWVCFAALYLIGGRLGAELCALRQGFEILSERPAAASVVTDKEFAAVDEALARLGFPKPNPMLAE